ncbi:MAG TPA: hypothetical protein VMV49_03465 [Candidatus Deferrimicrobium sp.]|nr:hypothetical protein [Candidatus Deferrimicrobium sp.]
MLKLLDLQINLYDLYKNEPIFIPANVASNPFISNEAKILFGILLSFKTLPKWQLLSARLNCGISKVQEAFRELQLEEQLFVKSQSNPENDCYSIDCHPISEDKWKRSHWPSKNQRPKVGDEIVLICIEEVNING